MNFLTMLVRVSTQCSCSDLLLEPTSECLTSGRLFSSFAVLRWLRLVARSRCPQCVSCCVLCRRARLHPRESPFMVRVRHVQMLMQKLGSVVGRLGDDWHRAYLSGCCARSRAPQSLRSTICKERLRAAPPCTKRSQAISTSTLTPAVMAPLQTRGLPSRQHRMLQ